MPRLDPAYITLSFEKITVNIFGGINMKKKNNSGVVFTAALAGAIAAGTIIAAYEAAKSEKGQACIAKAKTGVTNTAAKAKVAVVTTADKAKVAVVAAADKAKVVVADTAEKAKVVVADTAEKVKAGVATAADAIKSKLPCKAEACECDDLGLEEETASETEAAETAEAEA